MLKEFNVQGETMKKVFSWFAGLVFALSTSMAHAVVIDFDGLASGTIVGNTFPGVTFVDAQVTTAGGTLPGATSPNTIAHVADGVNTLPSNPIEAIFDALASSVTLTGIDIGFDGFQLLAYNVADILIDSASVIGSTPAGVGEFFNLTVTGAIKRVEFSQVSNAQGGGDGSVYDNFAFVPAQVPEPVTLALMGLGLAGIGYRRQRSKVAA